ncbi:gfo/Idh/MocA family oxidoreductase [Eubacterium sp. am_0171]|uniref:Gfo/Idh/MocA family protein n=2 Tax=Bacillota TaxID=1239 RepID=UPI00067F4DC6|nr:MULTISPECIES: Gfo/Idh/MocA family oxidoreductase [Clostridia]MSC83120.1 hypothetical protein [Eubacterium sp. BIOML-A1]MSD05608.1 hypothetical protein [Eubacterium sp. BIOML-A2]RYT24508.1 gfo/Idh/MocA family oxidoreductase [Eubacterium sp. am_0171]
MKTIKTGVIGCGLIAQMEWLPYLHELEEYEVVAVQDISRRAAEHCAKQYQAPYVFDDWRELIRHPEIEAVVILNQCHTEVCIEAVRNKKHVIVEKPLCENVNQAKRIEEAVCEENIVFMIGEMKRYDPGFLYAADIIAQMKSIRMLRFRDYCDGLVRSQNEILETVRRTDVDADLKNKLNQEFWEGMDAATGDIPTEYYYHLLTGGAHDIAMLRAIMGDPERVSYCDIWNGGNELEAAMVYGDKTRAFLEVGYTNHKWFDEEFVVYGEDQTVHVQFPNPYLKNAPTMITVKRMEGNMVVEEKIETSYQEAFRNELLHFYNCICNNLEPVTNVREARMDLELMAGILKAYQKE